MARKTILLRETSCIRCGKKIRKGRKAVLDQQGRSSFYFHPACYKSGYQMYHGRYVKKSNVPEYARR